MKWLKNEEVQVEPTRKKSVKERNITVRFSKKKQNKREVMTLFLSKDFLELAKENEMTHVRFGYDESKKQLVFKLNKNEQGLGLLNKEGKYRSIITVSRLLESLQENGVRIPINERMELHAKGKTMFYYNYDKAEAANEKEENQVEASR